MRARRGRGRGGREGREGVHGYVEVEHGVPGPVGGGEREGEDLDFVRVGGDGYEARLGVDGEAPGADFDEFMEEGGWLGLGGERGGG